MVNLLCWTCGEARCPRAAKAGKTRIGSEPVLKILQQLTYLDLSAP